MILNNFTQLHFARDYFLNQNFYWQHWQLATWSVLILLLLKVMKFEVVHFSYNNFLVLLCIKISDNNLRSFSFFKFCTTNNKHSKYLVLSSNDIRCWLRYFMSFFTDSCSVYKKVPTFSTQNQKSHIQIKLKVSIFKRQYSIRQGPKTFAFLLKESKQYKQLIYAFPSKF